MQLTRFTDLGLRVLMYLTQRDRVLPVTIAEMAEQLCVPHNHLVKVVTRLSKLGRVSTVRGRGGGLSLAQPPAEVRLGAVLEELEGSTQLVDCEKPACPLRGRCLLKNALNAGLEAFYSKMNEFTLADVSDERTGEALVSLHRLYLRNREERAV